MDTENVLLILLSLAVLVIIIHYKNSMEPFQNNDTNNTTPEPADPIPSIKASLDEKLNSYLASYKYKASEMEGELNNSPEMSRDFTSYYNKLRDSVYGGISLEKAEGFMPKIVDILKGQANIESKYNTNLDISLLTDELKKYFDTQNNPYTLEKVEGEDNYFIKTFNGYLTYDKSIIKYDLQPISTEPIKLQRITELGQEVNNLVLSSYSDRTIASLEKELELLDEDAGHLKPITLPRAIKSYQNGDNISVVSANNDKYLVALNGGCAKTGSDGSYDITKCNTSDNSQQFDIKNVYDSDQYNVWIQENDEVNPNDRIMYPFAMVRSVNTDNCLTNNYGKVSIEPCKVSKGQRWKLLDTNTKCMDYNKS
jgi:hypothetical protein